MNRNTEERFSNAAKVNIQRSKFLMSQNIKTSFSAGDIIPFYVDSDILPGDQFKIKLSAVIRMATPIKPVMDNCYADFYFFAVPYRLVWEHFKEFMGENKTGAWTQTTEYTIPQLKTGESTSFAKGDIMDYMGLPIGINNLSVSALPLRAYIKIYNDWFRDQTQIAPLTENVGDSDTNYAQNSSVAGSTLCKAGKFHDYFTSCLPDSQKGGNVSMPLGTKAQVYGDGYPISITNYTGSGASAISNVAALGVTDNDADGKHYIKPMNNFDSSAGTSITWKQNGNAYEGYGNNLKNTNIGLMTKAQKEWFDNRGYGVEVKNLTSGMYADLSTATAATINALRLAFATQRILEADARGGTRYTEVVRQHFHVTSPDARQQRPEYLGGFRWPINISQVLQNSSTDATTPQGNTAAFSLTGGSKYVFSKAFTEHSIILGLVVVRQEHSYQQGINRMWSRQRRLDFYWPALAHLGEQAIKNKEIYAQGSGVTDASGNIVDEQTFGFQERWAEYRYKPNIITGELRSTYTTPLDSWHYGDKYTSLPVLSQTFIEETKTYIDRTLAVQNQDQFIMDSLVNIEAVRPMPVNSIPGLLDHF